VLTTIKAHFRISGDVELPRIIRTSEPLYRMIPPFVAEAPKNLKNLEGLPGMLGWLQDSGCGDEYPLEQLAGSL
jgi:hypothetical protein